MTISPSWRRVTWPDGANISVSVLLAFEAFQKQSQFTTQGKPGQVDRFSLSYAEYGARVGIWRLLDLLEEEGVKASCAINGLAAEQHPEVIAALVDSGHEVVGHGWVNDVHQDENDEEAETISRSLDAIEHAGGVRPVGWVSPAMMSSDRTKELLVRENCIYSMDDASDDCPFVETVAGAPFVTLPTTSLASHDLRQWLRIGAGPNRMAESFKATFDQLHSEGVKGRPGNLGITLHAHVAGRPTLIAGVREIIRHAKRHEGVWWARNDEQARWAIDQNLVRG
jgi:peptidoglycan/xylan/chitin deacetylase (PgdA/CDA1 family)